jgi:chemotaxis regulatin CheY-phosphate phosphatase CheZ
MLLLFLKGSSASGLSVLLPCAGIASAAAGVLYVRSCLSARHERRNLYSRDAVLDGKNNVPEPGSVTTLMSGLVRTLSECPAEIRRVIDYPLINEILAAKNGEELARLLEIAHRRLLKADEIITRLSQHVVTDCLIYLPLAESVIRAVPSKTEEAAFAVLERFSVVHEASSRAAQSARKLCDELENPAGEKSVQRTAENSRRAVKSEREVIGELNQCTRENREHLQAMGREIESGLDLLKNITDITERSKLIAFNMSIEAARIGEKGRGFKVIIAELHKLNDRTFEFSRQVSELLARFRDYNALLVNNMEEKADKVIKQVEKGMDAAEAAVESLITASSHTEDFTREIAGMSESINRDMDGVLESLQFQDITRQMIEGAEMILGELRKNVAACLESTDVPVDEKTKMERFAATRSRLAASAKTKGEKNALMEVQL